MKAQHITSIIMQKLRYGFIGAGCQGCNHIENIRQLPAVEVAALADPHPPSITSALQICPNPESVRVYERYQDLLDDPTLDAVIIATPNHTHAAVVAEAVKRDKHIFIEKPLAHTPQDAAHIVRLADNFPKIFWVGMQYRYIPALARLRREVEAGVCGSIKMLTIREHRGPFLVKVENWNRFSHSSGGTLVEKCCHFFDLFNMLARSRPVRVFASGGADVNYRDEVYDGKRPDILDNAFVIIDYENGQRALLELCMFHPDAATHPHMFLSAVGDRGYIHATVPQNEIVIEDFTWRQSQRSTITEAPHTIGRHFGADLRVHQAFADCIRNGGTQPETTAALGALAVYVGAAAERSVQIGKSVMLAEIEAEVSESSF